MEKVKWLMVALVMVWLASMSSSANATILWDSGGYEADTATPDGSGDYDPADHVIGSRPTYSTYITESDPTYVQVFNTNSATWAPDAKYGSNYLKLSTGSANSTEELWIGQVSQDFYHSFAVYNRSHNGELKIQYGKRISSSTNVGGLNMKWINGAVQAYINGSWTTVATINNDEWIDYIVQLNFDSGAGTFTSWDFYVNGTQVLDDATLSNSTLVWINNIALYTGGVSDAVFVDAHLVQTGQVPEPATVALLVSSLAFLKKRK